MNKLLQFLVLVILILSSVVSKPAFAASLSGSEIHYVKVDTLTYDVYFVLYRSCNGLPFKISASNCKISNSDGTNVKSFTPTLMSITDVTPLCKTVKKTCYPPNTGFTGEGIERHIFKETIDFRKSGYDTIYQSGKPIVFTVGNCCRSTNITNGAASRNDFNYAFLDLSLGDVMGAKFNNPPIRNLGGNNANYYNINGVGYDKSDSVSYAFGDVLQGLNSAITTTQPFKIYDPVGRGDVNPNTNPPIGMYLDAKTGNWIFTPTFSDVPAVVIEMTVWRKNKSGIMQKITVIRRDFIYEVKTFPVSYGPLFTSNNSWSICEGETFSTVVNTGFSKTSTNSIYLYVLDTIAGSTNTILDTSQRQQFKFSWTPKVGQAKSQPYTFTLNAIDSSCYQIGQASRAFSIYVKPKPQSEVEVNALSCNVFKLTSKPTTNPGSLNYSWKLLDDKGQSEQTTDVVYFPSTNSAKSNLQNDSFYLRTAGTYIVEHKITNTDLCVSYWYDTISSTKSIYNLFISSDTVLCKGKGLSLQQDIHADSLFTSYLWSNGVVTKKTQIPFTDKSSKMYLRANTDTGCFYFDDIQVNQAEKPILIKPASIQRCGEIDSFVKFKVENLYSFTSTEFSWNQTKTDSIYIGESGIYTMQASNTCGNISDSVLFVELTIPKIDLGSKDTFFCAGEDLILDPNVKNNFSSPIYIWSDGSSESTLKVKKLGVYSVTVTNLCGQSSDTINVTKTVSKPEIVSINETFICNGKAAVIGGSYPDSEMLWSTGETSNYITVAKPGKIILEVTNGCGYDIDSVSIVEEVSPKVLLPTDTFYCGSNPIRLHGGGTNAWYVWSTGDKIRTVFLSKAGTYWVKAENGCGSDSFQFELILKQKPKFSLGNDTSLIAKNLILDAGESEGTYLWNTGAETRQILIDKQGLYWAEVTNVCGSFRDSINIKFTSIVEYNMSSFKIYPNPNNGVFVIKSKHGSLNDEISIIGLDGKMISPNLFNLNRIDAYSVECRLSKQLHGMYFIQILNEESISHVRVFIE